MKKIIERRLYDTETAVLLHESETNPDSDYNYVYEALYRTKKGNYFLYGRGGANTFYAKKVDSNTWVDSEGIMPMPDEDVVIQWLEHNGGTEVIEKYFASCIQEA